MLGEEIKELLYKAVEFLNEDLEPMEGISNMLTTVIIQLAATLVLFLVVRFCFWNKITKMIENRSNKIKESLQEKDEAIAIKNQALQEAEEVKKASKAEALAIVDQAKKQSELEALATYEEAKQKIAFEKEAMLSEIDKTRQEMQNGIRDEIVDVSILIAEKIVEHEVDKEDNLDIINQTLASLNNNKNKQ